MSKTYLIVGATSGIGSELVKQLKKQESSILSMSRTKKPDVNYIDHHYQIDVTESDPDFPTIDKAIDGIAYCPGSINLKPFSSLDAEDFQSDWDLNVMGLIKTLQNYHKSLKKSDQASVVAFSTVAVQSGMPFHASVSASKGAVEGVIRTLAAEWAPDIRVNAVAPSLTDTPMASRILNSDKRRKKSEKRHPLKRIGKPADIASAARYLLTGESDWVTGQVLHVDGGMSRIGG